MRLIFIGTVKKRLCFYNNEVETENPIIILDDVH